MEIRLNKKKGIAVVAALACFTLADVGVAQAKNYIMRGGGTSIQYDVRKGGGNRHHYVVRCGTRWYFRSKRAKRSFLKSGFGGLKSGHVGRWDRRGAYRVECRW